MSKGVEMVFASTFAWTEWAAPEEVTWCSPAVSGWDGMVGSKLQEAPFSSSAARIMDISQKDFTQFKKKKITLNTAKGVFFLCASWFLLIFK